MHCFTSLLWAGLGIVGTKILHDCTIMTRFVAGRHGDGLA